MTINLLSCPFCGHGEPSTDCDDKGFVSVYCVGCGVRSFEVYINNNGYEKVVAAWNTRA